MVLVTTLVRPNKLSELVPLQVFVKSRFNYIWHELCVNLDVPIHEEHEKVPGVELLNLVHAEYEAPNPEHPELQLSPQ